MNFFTFVFFHLLFFIIKIKTKASSLILKFETESTSLSLTPDDYFESKFTNGQKTFIKAGTHRQMIPCYINLNTHTFYLSGSESNLIKTQIKYEEYKSTKYHNTSDKITYESFYVYGMPSIDEFCLSNDKIIDLKFYLAKSKFSSNELTHSCIIGLGYEQLAFDENKEEIYTEGIESFITQMKNNNIINKKIYFLNYNDNDNDNGEIIFGVYPHEINDKYCKSCIEENYIEMDNTFISDIEIVWSVKGYIYVGENMIYDYLSSINFELNKGFIIGSYNYKKNIEKNFFNEKILKNEFFKKEIYMENNVLEGFYCNKNIDITKIESLIINIDKIKYKIEFTYEDLLNENNEYLYFNVLFTSDTDTFKNDFILGKPFFKKYPIVFNINERVEKIGFYYNLFNQNNNKIIRNNNNNSKINILKIILIIIGIGIIVLLIYISIKYFKKPRKQKVNELIEFFDYSSTQNRI